MIEGLASALEVAAEAAAAGIRPPKRGTVAQWAERSRVVSAESGSPFPGPWRHDRSPHLVEIMDCCSFSHPARSVVFKKSAQVAGTEIGLNMFGYVVDEAPAPMLFVLPSLEQAKLYNKSKLQPTIDATPILIRKVKEVISRDDEGSTASNKRFRGGFAVITGANSSKGLQMISARVLVADEISEYPADVAGRGDPVTLAERRLLAWLGQEKKIYTSTPRDKGTCRISKLYEASDQRKRFVPCPHCGEFVVLEWLQFKWTEEPTLDVWYECQACKARIGEEHREDMIRAGVWRATCPGPGRDPGFHIWQAYSLTSTWGEIVRDWLRAKDDPAALKVFWQQTLGLEWEITGDAPDANVLYQRREAFRMGHLPPGALIITGAADVQQNRVEYLIRAWGIGRQSWIIDRGVVEGDPTKPGVWRMFDKVLTRRYPNAAGTEWPIEAFAFDTGFHSHAVYRYVRRAVGLVGEGRVLAIKGSSSQNAPAIGSPNRVEVMNNGRPMPGGVMLWPVGSWSLKSQTYGYLKIVLEHDPRLTAGNFPPGYVHFANDLDEEFFKQLTSESLVPRVKGGAFRHIWVKQSGRRNEALDLMVYTDAMATHLGVDRLSPQGWLRIAAQRGAPADASQLSLALYEGLVPLDATADEAIEALREKGIRPPDPPPAIEAKRPAPETTPPQAAARPEARRDESYDSWSRGIGDNWFR